MRKTRFDLVFRDPNYQDWFFILHTSEPKTDKEIEDLIMNFADMCNTGGYEYSPVDIMDRIIDYMESENRYWWWEDGPECLEITDW